ncbi:MAG: hypothetical protein M3347_04760 [Armatimonadota bacterium]|nr:hypothetical protein [Armatimonadota bacterium]
MTLDNTWMIAMVVMFGLFLWGLWHEVRRSLRALSGVGREPEDIREWRADYQAVMARREARRRLERLRVQQMREAERRLVRQKILCNGYDLGPDEMHGVDVDRLLEKVDLNNLVFAGSGARTQATRERNYAAN